jgi:hypothetical protein
MKTTYKFFAVAMLTACGSESTVTETVVIEKPVFIEKRIVVTPTPVPKVIQCRVYAVDSLGNITYLSHDDRFYSNILMSKVFTEDESKKIVELKDGKYNSGKSKVIYYCK